MGNCSKCGRSLESGEHELCPACKSKRSWRWGKFAEGLLTVVVVVGGFIAKKIIDRHNQA